MLKSLLSTPPRKEHSFNWHRETALYVSKAIMDFCIASLMLMVSLSLGGEYLSIRVAGAFVGACMFLAILIFWAVQLLAIYSHSEQAIWMYELFLGGKPLVLRRLDAMQTYLKNAMDRTMATAQNRPLSIPDMSAHDKLNSLYHFLEHTRMCLCACGELYGVRIEQSPDYQIKALNHLVTSNGGSTHMDEITLQILRFISSRKDCHNSVQRCVDLHMEQFRAGKNSPAGAKQPHTANASDTARAATTNASPGDATLRERRKLAPAPCASARVVRLMLVRQRHRPNGMRRS